MKHVWVDTTYNKPDYNDEDWYEKLGINPAFEQALQEAPETGRIPVSMVESFPPTAANRLSGDFCNDPDGTTCWAESIEDIGYVMISDLIEEKTGDAVCYFRFENGRRMNALATQSSFILLDIDCGKGGGPTPDDIFTALDPFLEDCFLLLHPSFSHGRAKPAKKEKAAEDAWGRYRLGVFYNGFVNGMEEQYQIHKHLSMLLEKVGIEVDPATKDASRLVYLPRFNPKPLEAPYVLTHPQEPPQGWLAVRRGRSLLNLQALPDGKGGTVSLQSLVEREREKVEASKKRRATATKQQDRKTVAGRMAHGTAAQKARRWLDRDLEALRAGAPRTGSRNTCVHYLGAQCARWAHYLTEDYVSLFKDRVIDAAMDSGLPEDDLERQYDRGWDQGCDDGPSTIADRRTTRTFSGYARMFEGS